ncbi:hypothetical protein F4819DRAFT_492256 [Hypoxylon fuscum]|nr:hypothetical protein F4819DRAFT_492256 [Hypoxylon fuscum]
MARYLAVWCCLMWAACSVGFLTQGCQKDWRYEDGEARTYCFDHVCNVNSYTAIPLDWCLADKDGVLIPQELGNFRRRCFDCKVASDNYHLGCNCIKVDGTVVHNDVLCNWWGWLSCFGHYEKTYTHDYYCKDQAGWMPDPSVPDMTCGNDGCPEVLPPIGIKLTFPPVANASFGNASDAMVDVPRRAGQSGPPPRPHVSA